MKGIQVILFKFEFKLLEVYLSNACWIEFFRQGWAYCLSLQICILVYRFKQNHLILMWGMWKDHCLVKHKRGRKVIAFVFLCFEEHIVELSEAENYFRMGREPSQSMTASLHSSYRGCDLTSCGLLKNPTLSMHGIPNRVNNHFEAGVGCPPFSWSVVNNWGKNSRSFLRGCGSGFMARMGSNSRILPYLWVLEPSTLLCTSCFSEEKNGLYSCLVCNNFRTRPSWESLGELLAFSYWRYNVQSHAGQPEVKMKLKPDLVLPGHFEGAIQAIVMSSMLSAGGKRCCSVSGALPRVFMRGPSAALESSHSLKVQWASAESELSVKVAPFLFNNVGAKVGCGLHVSQLLSRKIID